MRNISYTKRSTMKYNAQTVEEYLQQLEPERRSAIETLRALVFEIAPGAEESMRYGMPTYSRKAVFCAIASQKHYLSLYIMNTALVEKYKSRLKGLEAGKSCIRFKKLENLPLDVIKNMLKESL